MELIANLTHFYLREVRLIVVNVQFLFPASRYVRYFLRLGQASLKRSPYFVDICTGDLVLVAIILDFFGVCGLDRGTRPGLVDCVPL